MVRAIINNTEVIRKTARQLIDLAKETSDQKYIDIYDCKYNKKYDINELSKTCVTTQLY